MAVELRPLDDLDPALVSDALAETVARVQEDNPTLDLRLGPFFSVLAYYHAVLATQRQVNVNDYLRARSLKELEADPDLADDDLVEGVLSNYRVSRKEGERSAGEVTVVVGDDVTVVVGVGAVFEAGGGRFVTERVYTAKLEESQVDAAGDRLLTPTADGNWAFTIDVIAEEVGASFEVKKDAAVVPLSLPPGYVNSFAASDFSGGLSAETNADMLGRLQLGVAAKAVSNRVNMQAMLREVEEFSRVVASSIVGYGDPEMHRDRHSIFPVSMGGRVDWYVRTQSEVMRLKVTKEATLVAKGADGLGTWQVSLGRDDAPGFYEVVSVRPADAEEVVGTYEILSEDRAIDLTGLGFAPDVTGLAEGAYSRFQTAVVRFADTATRVDALSLGAHADYDVEVRVLPLVGEIQDYVSSRDVRGHGADCLIRAPVPCFVTINFGIYKQAGEETPDLDAVRAAVCAEVNSVGFVGRLYASAIHDAIGGHLRDNVHASGLDMHGRIRYPLGSDEYVRSNEVLVIPDDPGAMVSPRTVQFFCSPEDVGIAVHTAVPSNL